MDWFRKECAYNQFCQQDLNELNTGPLGIVICYFFLPVDILVLNMILETGNHLVIRRGQAKRQS